MKKFNFKKHTAIWLLLVTTLIFRGLYSATHVGFGQDVARDAYLTKQRLSTKRFIVDYGPKASVGNFYLPPFYYQAHLIFSSLTGNHPLTMKWVITLTESLTPIMLYLIFKRMVKKEIALAGALLYAFAATPTIFGTTAWNPDMIPFFAALALYSWLVAVVDKKFIFLIPGILASSIAFQLHYQSAVLLPFALLIIFYLLISQHKNYWPIIKYSLVGLALSVALLLPYAQTEIQHQFFNTKQIVNYFTQEHSKYFDRVSKPNYVFKFFPTFFEMVLFDKEQPHHIFGLVFYFGGGLLLLWAAWRSPNRNFRWMLLYLLTIVIMLRVYKGDKIVYYMSTLYFWPIFMATLIMDKLGKRWQYLIVGVVALMMGLTLSHKPMFNQLTELKSAMTYLENNSPSRQVHFLFHDDDHANTIAYGLKYMTSISNNPRGNTVVDVCNWNQQCVWDGTLRSNYDRAYSGLAGYKAEAGYHYLSQYPGKHPFKLVLGQVDNNEVQPDTSSYLYQGEYGNDFILQ